MKRVFISYCHEDGDFSDTLRRKLEEAGFATWQDTDLYGGQQWRVEIDLAIREAPAVIVVLSPEAVRSDYVNYEWAFALGAGVNVVPVLLRPGTEALHPALQSRQYLDFSNRLARPWDLLFRAVKGISSQAPQSTIRVPPGAPPVLEQAARSLDSMDEGQRSAALDTLEAMKSDAVFEVLAGATLHPIREVRFRAAQILLGYGDRRALPGVFEALRAGYSMSFSFKKLNQEALPDLLAALRDESPSVRGAATKAIGEIGDPGTIPELKRLLDDETPWVRRLAVEALGEFRDPALLSLFQDAYHRNDEMERGALEVAAALPNSAGECLLLEGLKHPDSNVRHTAAELLGKGATAAALRPLCSAIKDSEIYVRAAVVDALGQFRQECTIDVLVEALDDDSSDVRNKARKALARLADPAVVAVVVDALHDRERLYREEPARLLGELGDPAVVPVLVEVLGEKDAHSDLIDAAATSVGQLARPGSPAVNALVGLLANSRPQVVEMAVRALGTIGDPSSVTALGELLNVENKDVRNCAHDALARIGTPEARRLLVMKERRQWG
jgi:HEAT repeat protein